MNKLSLGMMGTLSLGAVLSGLLLAAVSESGAGSSFGVAYAASPATTETTKKEAATLSEGDKAFMLEAASGGMAEVELSQMAKEKSKNADVIKLAQHMVEDHTKANGELTGLAARKGVTLPTELLPKHKETREKLAKLTGAAFDKEYARVMVKDHEDTVALFQKEAGAGKDPNLVPWVKQTLPTLEGHLKMARESDSRINGNTKAAGKSM